MTQQQDIATQPHIPRAKPRRFRWIYRLGCLLPLLAVFACAGIYLLFPPPSLDILILGLDARPGERYLTRTDSVMLLNVSPDAGAVTLLSIPRDVAIYVPYYGEQRINVINVLGEQEEEGTGPDLLKASFTESFDVQVERYIRFNFAGFVALIDAVGGVDIDVPKLIIDYAYPTADNGTITVQFDPGKQHLDGERALQYARTRHQDDDYQRAGRQQQVVDALVKKLASPAGISYWSDVWQVMQTHTDTDLNAWDMVTMAPTLILGWPSRTSRVLQREDLVGTSEGYWRPNYEQLLPWMADHFD